MKGRWMLGRVSSELVMVPAPTLGEIMECFAPGELQANSAEDGFTFVHKSGQFVKSHRIVDAAAEIWILVGAKS
jgi:hypothetical protein